MPYDYYDYFKKKTKNKNYDEITDIVKEKIWNDSFDFNSSMNWMTTEEKIMLILYLYLRYN